MILVELEYRKVLIHLEDMVSYFIEILLLPVLFHKLPL